MSPVVTGFVSGCHVALTSHDVVYLKDINYFEQNVLERLKEIQWVCGLYKHIAKPNTFFLMAQKIPPVKQLACIPDYVIM